MCVSLNVVSFQSQQQEMVPNGVNHVTYPKWTYHKLLGGRGAVTDLPSNNFAICILQLLNARRSWWLSDSHNFIIASSVSIIIWTWLLSFWCLTCDAVTEPSCHDSHHLVLERSKDGDEMWRDEGRVDPSWRDAHAAPSKGIIHHFVFKKKPFPLLTQTANCFTDSWEEWTSIISCWNRTRFRLL